MHNSRERVSYLPLRAGRGRRNRPGRRAARRPLSRQRSLSLRTNLSPDHVSSIAHTFTSTRPEASPKSRTIPSLRSLATPDVFFGQATHNIPFDSRRSRKGANSLARSAFIFTNRIAKSTTPPFVTRAGVGISPSNARKSRGAATKTSRAPVLLPHLLTSVLPAYPNV